MLETTSEIASHAAAAVIDAANNVPGQVRELTLASSSEEPAASPAQTQVQAKKDTAPATAAGSLSASVPGRQWIMGKEAFEATMPHHEGIKALWETKWKFPCSKSLYPFHDGKYQDFEPIFKYLIENDINDGTSPAYTEAFIRAAERLVREADALTALGNVRAASDVYLRACTVYRIARFPYITSLPEINDATKWRAWTAQKEAYLKAASTWDDPVEEVTVPYYTRAKPGEDEDEDAEGRRRRRRGIPVYVRTPSSTPSPSPASPPGYHHHSQPHHRRQHATVILLTGLDGYRPDNTTRCDEFLRRGWASIVVEIPGTADCPADPADPTAPERLWDSLLEWMEADGRFDMGRVMVWGLSSGGYYAVRIAHTHAKRLIGVVAQGAGCHHFFDREWLDRADGHEYPFRLTPAMALKHGYRTVEEYKAGVQKKFSLLENRILEMPSTRLLLVNGVSDGLMPIEDSMMLFEHGSPKEARFFPGLLHMGYPPANGSVYPWMESVMKQTRL